MSLAIPWRSGCSGTVGFSGVFVNLGAFYAGLECLFRLVASADNRLNISLAMAIFCATVNNFMWNRAWTWRDRKHHPGHRSRIAQFGEYPIACWVGIVLQVIFTKWLAMYLHYLVANTVSIVLASVFNFVVNDIWTFRRRKAPVAKADD